MEHGVHRGLHLEVDRGRAVGRGRNIEGGDTIKKERDRLRRGGTGNGIDIVMDEGVGRIEEGYGVEGRRGTRERNGRGMEGGGEIHESMVMKRAMGWRRMNRIGRRGDIAGSIDIIGRGATGRGTTGRGMDGGGGGVMAAGMRMMIYR